MKMKLLFSVLAAGALAVAALPASSPVAPQGARAYAAFVRTPSRAPLLVADTNLDLSGHSERFGSELSIAVPRVLFAETPAASVTTGQGRYQGSASLSHVVLFPGSPEELQAFFLRAEARAGAGRALGTSRIVGLKVAGRLIDATGASDQVVALPGGGTLVLNEQVATTFEGRARIAVAAVHYTTGSGREAVLARAVVQDEGGGGTDWPECHDFCTGGGWILSGDDHANFGFNAGFHDGEPQPVIHFNYIDHGTGMHMKADTITEYGEGSTPTARHMEGSCTIDDVPGFTYMIDVEDNGEPGVGVDFLGITLSNGYAASGLLSGGNIQIHGECE